VLHAAHDEPPAHGAHHGQQRRADQGEPEHASQDHLPGSHRLGGHRLNGLRLEVGREAEDGEDQGHHADEEVRRGEDESEVQLARVDARRVEEPTGEEHEDREQCEHHQHVAPQRFLDGEPGQRPDPPRGHPGEVLNSREDPPVDTVTGLQRPVHRRLHEPGCRGGNHRDETRGKQIPEERRADPLRELRNRLFQNHVPLPRCVSPLTKPLLHDQPRQNRFHFGPCPPIRPYP